MAKKWYTICEPCGYVIEEIIDGSFAGRFVDRDENTVYFMGNPMNMIGWSYDRDKTERITKEQFEEMID